MHYREIRPKPPLSDHIECFWVLQGDGQVQSPPERLLPDGCIELIFNFGDPFNEHVYETGIAEPQPLRFIVGQMTRPVLISPTGRIDILGVSGFEHSAGSVAGNWNAGFFVRLDYLQSYSQG